MMIFTFSARCSPDGSGIRVDVTATDPDPDNLVAPDISGQIDCNLATWTQLKRALCISRNDAIQIEEK